MRARDRGARALGAALLALAFVARGAPPQELTEEPRGQAPLAGLDAAGAAGRLAAIDARLRELDGRRTELEAQAASREGERRDEGRRARRLAREILLSELHGRAMASSPRELVQNATMRSGLRRVASRTLAAHGSRARAVDAARAELGALGLEEAKLQAERVAAESALRLEQEEERRRREALRQIFEAEPGDLRVRGGHARVRVAEAGSDEDGDGAREESFRARKGKLALPVQRRCRIKSKRSEEFGGAYVAITSAKPSNVRAVGAGTVAFADELPPYGKLVVLDHGDGYFSVYGGLSRIGTGAGAALQEGAVVGGLDAEAPLVFQIRAGSRTLTPASWFRQRSPSAEEPAP
jgi:murein DD-endopeptidase MepM/ murein hydrolase activator NlpD